MSTIIFWIVFLGIIVFAIISNYKKSVLQEQDRENCIRESYGARKSLTKDAEIPNELINGYINYLKTVINDDEYAIDEITWNDLGLNNVFNVINSTYSSPGEEVLYSKLHILNMKGEVSKKFYDEVLFYSDHEEVRYKVLKALSQLGKLKKHSAFEVINNLFKAKKQSVKIDVINDFVIIISFLLIFASPSYAMLVFLVSLFYSILRYFKEKSLMEENLRAYCYVLNIIKSAVMINEVLGEKGRQLDGKVTRLTSGVRLVGTTEGTSSNPLSLLLDYIKMIFHLDIISYNNRLSTIIDNKQEILELYEFIGYADAQISIASYCSSVDTVCRPNILEGELRIDAKGIYHPLTKDVVKNDISTNRGVLITGSNASGKSTFLKTIGINTIFSLSFGFALADSLSISPFRLYTSMALKDNLLGAESYYVVETRSLKRICDAANDYQNVLCIVDEVLRGTNTIERIAASTEILKYLSDKNSICFVATHDIELAELLRAEYELYYFAENIIDNNVIFPYLINKGVSKGGNAIKLLEVMNYHEKIVNGANSLAANYIKTGKWEDN